MVPALALGLDRGWSGVMLEGIDVSHWQGPISWPKVKAAGKQFAIIASGDGTFLDPRFEENLEGACLLPHDPDIYHYLRFALTPEQQAEVCLRRLEVAQRYNPKARLWLDLEDTSTHAESLTPENRRRWLRELWSQLPLEINLGLYTGVWWWNTRMGNFGEFPLWVAAYVGLPVMEGVAPVLPQGWSDWAIWQYTSSGRVDGIEGNVDLNLAKPGVFEEGDMDEAKVKRLAREEVAWDLLNLQARLAVASELAEALAYALGDVRPECKTQIELARLAAEQWFPE